MGNNSNPTAGRYGFNIITVVTILSAVGVVALVWFFTQQNQATNTGTAEPHKPAKTFTDACLLVPKSELENIFGVTFNDFKNEPARKSTENLDGSQCTTEQTNDGTVPGMANAINVTFTIENYGTTQKAIAQMDLVRKSAKFGDKVYFERTDVPGVGDEAFFQSLAPVKLQPEEFLYVRKGSQVFHFVAVQIDSIDHPKVQSQLIELAKRVLN